MSSETDLLRNQAIQNQRNFFLRGFPLPFKVETLQYYRKFLYCKTKMLVLIHNGHKIDIRHKKFMIHVVDILLIFT
jgi:hypothetical protein